MVNYGGISPTTPYGVFLEVFMKKFTLTLLVAFLVFASCNSVQPVPDEYKSYSETFSVTGLDSKDIFIKTFIWIEEIKRWAISKDSDYLNLKGEFTIPFDYKKDEFKPLSRFSFKIKDEYCQINFISTPYYHPRERIKPATWMDIWKNIADEFRTYINTPPVSKVEIDQFLGNGDTAFNQNDFSTALRNYSKAMQNMQYEANLFLLYAVSFDRLRSFHTETLKINPGEQEVIFRFYGNNAFIFGGYLPKLKDLLYDDLLQIDYVQRIYNLALTIEPNNETALVLFTNCNERKSFKNDLYSQVQARLEYLRSVAQIENAQQYAERWANAMNNLAYLAGGSGQSQYGSDSSDIGTGGYSSGSSSGGGRSNSSGSSSNQRTCSSCKGSGKCSSCDGTKKQTSTAYYTGGGKLEYNCPVCKGSGNCGTCRGYGYIK